MKMSLTPIAVAILLAGAHVYGQAPLAVPGAPVAKDVPGAKELPNPNTVYKVVFSIGKPSKDAKTANPALTAIANYVNTLAKYGVPIEHRRIAVMIHHRGPGWEMILKNDAYRRATEGLDNPNIEMIQKLQAAGVEFRVCGQLLVARKINPEDMLPGMQADLWAMTSLVDLQMDGYVHIAM
jgi:intracellular sulfur oxidation DsrE/DsrF family protein